MHHQFCVVTVSVLERDRYQSDSWLWDPGPSYRPVPAHPALAKVGSGHLVTCPVEHGFTMKFIIIVIYFFHSYKSR